ncbi:MAG: type II toxin-antitoxin system RatA family toxin [Rhodospirillales bacterium]
MPTHAEIRRLPYRADQMFDLVADVGRYPEFLPWCQATRIRERSDTLLVADMVIGFKIFRERFTSRVTLDWEARRIDVAYSDGPFKYLKNHWIFAPAENGQGCDIDFYVDFEFRSKLLQSAISVVFNEAVTKMVNAFESRADDLYGGAPTPSGAGRAACGG